jgi:hypothetical protein
VFIGNGTSVHASRVIHHDVWQARQDADPDWHPSSAPYWMLRDADCA